MTSSLWTRAAATKRLVRVVLAAGLATVVVAPIVAGSADAKGKPAIVTLACGSVDVQGQIYLESGINGLRVSDIVQISCTANTTSKFSIHATSQPAPDFVYQIGADQAQGARGAPGILLSSGETLSVT
jgi:hypothetical protein